MMMNIANERSGVWAAARAFAFALLIVASGCSSNPGTAGSGRGGSQAGGGPGADGGGSGGGAAGSAAGASGAVGANAGGRGGSAVGSAGAGGGGSPGRAGGGGAVAGAAGGAGALGGTGGTNGTAGAGGTIGTGGKGGTSGIAGTGGSAGTGAGANCLRGDVNVPSTNVSGTITLNGGSLTGFNGYVSVTLGNAGGDIVSLGVSRSYSLGVIPGTYDVYYTWRDPAGTTLVTNSPIKIRSGVVIGASPVTLDVDVPATTVSGTFTVKGATITTWQNGDATLWLRSAAGEDVELSTTMTGTFSALVHPGTYDLYYRQYQQGPAVPSNTSTKIKSGIVVGSSPVTLTFDVPATAVSGAITFNGQKITGADKGSYVFTLRNAAGDSAELTSDFTKATYSGLVIPGTYDLYYSYAGVGIAAPAVPRNQSGKVQSAIVVGAAPLALDINVPITTVSGTATINGSAVTAPIGDTLSFRNAAGDQVPFSDSGNGSLTTLAIPDTYDLVYTSHSRAGQPDNTAAKIRSGIVVGASPVTLGVDIPTATVSGMVTVNGAMISDTKQGYGFLTLSGDGGDSVRLAATTGSYSKVVIAGTYNLSYAKSADGSAVPTNQSARLKQGIVVGSAPVPLDIDVPAIAISGNVTLNGGSVSGNGAASLFLYGANGDIALIGGVSATSHAYSALVVPGSYHLYYLMYTSDPAIPNNMRGDLGCFDVPAAAP
jgi:hypothetical protein